jgi:hypothetical protein
MSVARLRAQARRSRSPVGSGLLVRFRHIRLVALHSGPYVAMHRRDVVAPPDAKLLEYVRRNWTENDVVASS